MKITTIREFDKKRSEVLTDEALRFVLYNAEIRKLGLTEEEELAAEVLEEIMTVILPKRAKLRAMNLLKDRDYTESRLRSKLADGGYPEQVIDEAIAYVRSYHYIDDERYARDFIRGRMSRSSRARIRMDLKQRGIDQEIIDAAFEEIYADELLAGEDPELEQIRRQIAKKHFDAGEAPWEEKQKFLAAMARKGFSPDKVRRVMEEKE
jgi:regulatory protein